MRTKSADVPYCGVDREKIEKAKPLLDADNQFYLKTWIEERYRIHLLKDVEKKSKPWTQYSPLQNYKFTNVKRYHDKETRKLLKHIIKPCLSIEERMLNIILFRIWNKWKTMEIFQGPWDTSVFNAPDIKEIMRPYYHVWKQNFPDYVWFGNAFNTGGAKAALKFPQGDGYQRAYSEEKAKKHGDWEKDIPLRPFHLIPICKERDIIQRILKSKNQAEVLEILKELPSISNFLGYQIFVDFTYMHDFPFSENEFTVSGPGCHKGLELLFKDRDGLTDEELIFWLRDNQEILGIDFYRLFCDLPEYDRHLTVMDIENCMCEHSKHMKIVKGTGRPKLKYNGKPDNSSFGLL